MKTLHAAVVCTIAVMTLSTAHAHEMFLRPGDFIVPPNSDQEIRLINGTFDRSENSIERKRIADVSIVTPEGVQTPLETAWYDDAVSSWLRYSTGRSGTYVIGVSTRPSVIELSREDFIAYLQHDGVLDTLAEFEESSELKSVRERYSKHVRAVVQVGEATTEGFNESLGYPVEILLEQNPYELDVGDELAFRVTFGGEPVPNQLVRAVRPDSHEHGASPAHDHDGAAQGSYSLRTDGHGRARFVLSDDGAWYIALIHMQRTDGGDVDYESNWATATFFVD